MVNGAATVPGKVGEAFSFDGVDDYVSVPDSLNLNFGTGDFTVDAWIKTSADTTNVQQIVQKTRTGTFEPSWLIRLNSSERLQGFIRTPTANVVSSDDGVPLLTPAWERDEIIA